MNHLVSMLLLAVFAAQHFMCCCSGLGAHASKQDQVAPTSACEIASESGESACCDEECCQEHGDLNDWLSSHESGCPCNGKHQHHLCSASHIFFTASPRTELPPSFDWHHFAVWPTESPLLVTLASLTSEAYDDVDIGPPLTAQARRSALCVYRI